MADEKELGALMDYALNMVRRHIDNKEISGKIPQFAYMNEMSSELMEDFKTVLNQLVKEGVLSWHRNINGMLMFEFKKR